MKNQKFSIRARIKSFSYALNGLKALIKNEHNAWIHLLAMFVVVAAGFVCDISKTEWLVVIIVIGFVFSMEIINSAIEHLANFVSPNYSEAIKTIKDLAASAVLISAITSVIVAAVIFVPKIIEMKT